MLRPLAGSSAALGARADWPRREALQSLVTAAGVTNARGIPLRLVQPASAMSTPYEAAIYERGELQVRESDWHDLFNVLAWLAYPRTKAALNARHVQAAAAERREAAAVERRRAQGDAASTVMNRGRVRDALTLFDESGAVFACAEPELIAELRAFRWKNLFCMQRELTRAAVRVYVVGHALFEKALNPYIGMTAHALPLVVGADFMTEPPERQLERVDRLAAEVVADAARFGTPQSLAPLPVLGVPGWWAENEHEGFYDNTAYFRPARRRLVSE